MQKIIILSAAAMMMVVNVKAQTSNLVAKDDLKTLHKQEKVIKKEIKEEKKEMRKLEGNEASYQAKEAFYRDFGDIPATWVRRVYFDEATFTKDGKTTTAYYDYSSNLVGTTRDATFSELPGKAQKYIHKKYKGYNFGDVVFFDDNEANETDMILYGRPFDDADNYFIEVQKGSEKIILQVSMSGSVNYFKKM